VVELAACKQVRESLVERAKEFNIQLDDVAITHLSFGTEARPHSAPRMPSVGPAGCARLIVQPTC
jgi:hypothetical protein